MAAQPKKRTSRERQGKRRKAIKLNLKQLAKCSNCGNPTLPHLVCRACGFYKGKAVIKKKEKVKVTKV